MGKAPNTNILVNISVLLSLKLRTLNLTYFQHEYWHSDFNNFYFEWHRLIYQKKTWTQSIVLKMSFNHHKKDMKWGVKIHMYLHPFICIYIHLHVFTSILTYSDSLQETQAWICDITNASGHKHTSLLSFLLVLLFLLSASVSR